MRTTRTLLSTLILTCVLAPAALHAQEHGRVELETSCQQAAAEHLNTGTTLLHHMMYEQAEAAFQEAFLADPACAMAQWGIAMTQLHPLWAPPTEQELFNGREAVDRARQLEPGSERERAYIDAISAFFHTDGSFAERLAAWEAGQKSLHEAYPDDVDAAAFYALSRLATAPRNDKSFAAQAEAGAMLEDLLKKAPRHPGLFHYTIHAYDNPVLADKATRVAREYDHLAPEIPHALHMPSHIFVRQGSWDDVISWNRRSADAALKNPVKGATSMHFAHAMDYLVYAHLQRGMDDEARADLKELMALDNFQPVLAAAYALAAGPARVALERRDWGEAAALPVREPGSLNWEAFPAAESITWFAKGLGAARSGDTEAARAAVSRLGELHGALTAAGESYWAVLTEAQQKAVDAWVKYEAGDKEEGLRLMREAADTEDSVDKHPVTPSAVLPARELLGEMLLLENRPGEALEAFEASLAISRNRLNSLSGAGRAAELMGDTGAAASYYDEALELIGERQRVSRPRIDEARLFASSN